MDRYDEKIIIDQVRITFKDSSPLMQAAIATQWLSNFAVLQMFYSQSDEQFTVGEFLATCQSINGNQSHAVNSDQKSPDQ